ncbi:MAG TPA: hypothetical protein VFF69_09815 [Phycisphaerales bacterium]|nr:hypothetical protein [Phycisphaerales bacterium]
MTTLCPSIVRIVAAAAALGSGAASAQTPALAWVALYNGPASHQDHAACVLADAAGVYVAGTSYSVGESTDMTILRYSSAGQLVWERHFVGPAGGGDEPSDIAAHPGGGVVVVGYTTGIGARQITTLRFSAEGDLLWERHRPSSGFVIADWGPRVAVGPGGTVHVSGVTEGDYLALAYATDGAPRWEAQLDLSAGALDSATDIAAGGDGSVYITGAVDDGRGGYSTVKLDASGGHEWTHNEFGPFGSTLGPAFIEPSPDGAVIVSGVPETTCGLFQSRTWKLAPDGAPVWMSVFPPEPCGTVDMAAMAVGEDGSVVVLAQSLRQGEPGSHNYGLFKCDASGEMLWWRTLDGPGGSTDIPGGLAIDGAGNAHIAGMSWVGGGLYDAVVAAYSPAGALLWTDRFDLGASNERPAAVGVSARGEAYVAGSYQEAGEADNIFLLKYHRLLRSASPR